MVEEQLGRLRALKGAIEEMRQVLGSLEVVCDGVIQTAEAASVESVAASAQLVATTVDGIHLNLFQWEMATNESIQRLQE